ncbi:MAG TPA: CHRD domain-containing protein [Gaiellaceae bacterium]
MRKLVLSLVVVCALALTAASLAGTRGSGWSAKLTAAQEIPRQVVSTPAASGVFTATLSGNTLKWKLSFSKLSGPALAAHIHFGATGKYGNVLVTLCSPCKNGASGSAALTAAVKKDFSKHLLYVNVHTGKNLSGEIRGQLGG